MTAQESPDDMVLMPRTPTQAIRSAMYMAQHYDMSVQSPDEWGAVDKAYAAAIKAQEAGKYDPLAASAPPAGQVSAGVGADRWRVDLDEDQVRELFAFIASVDGEFPPISLLFGNGHSGRGLYMAHTEYPEEGAQLLASVKFPLSQSFVDRVTSEPGDEPVVMGLLMHDFVVSPRYGGKVCRLCGVPEGARRAMDGCDALHEEVPPHPAAPTQAAAKDTP